MEEKLNIPHLFTDKRARVYLLWMILVTLGFVATHFVQRKQINGFWFLLSVIGLGYMCKVMPLKDRRMRLILLAWFVPIAFGMIVSGLSFQIDVLASLSGYLGVFWLLVMAAGYLLNGIVDSPSGWYWFAVALNVVAAVLCYFVQSFTDVQYLVAAIVSCWSMANLWLFRSEAD